MLLGDRFKRQLKYDGTQSAITFICSKTDDISITEASDSLQLGRRIRQFQNETVELKQTADSLQRELDALSLTRAALGEAMDNCEAEHDAWRELEGRFENGTTVYAPDRSKRRGRPRQCRGRRGLADEINVPGSERGGGGKILLETEKGVDGLPLTEGEITGTISSLRAERSRILDERRAVEAKISECYEKIAKTGSELEACVAEVKAACIRGRNDYSRKVIQQDFAMGVKE